MEETNKDTLSSADAHTILEQVLASKGITGFYGLSLNENGNISLISIGAFKGDSLMMLGGHAALGKLTESACGMKVVTSAP